MKIKEMRAMPVSEAEKQVAEFRAELAKERAVAAGGTRPENPGKIRGVRKNIARLLTVISEKKRAGEISGVKKAAAAEAGAKHAEKKAPVAQMAKKAVEEKKPKAKAIIKKAVKGKAKKGVKRA